MKTLSFTYVKPNGVTSQRVLSVLKHPNTMYEGIDISELSFEQQGQFVAELRNIHDKYLAAIQALKTDFDLTHNYRRFDPLRMSDVASETL